MADVPKNPLPGSDANNLPKSSRPLFGWRRGDQIVFGTLLVLGIALIAIHWAWISGWGMRPVEIERQDQRPFEFRLDINQANWIEWTQLPGVGDQLARRIVAYREQNGPFQSVDELKQVQGIGSKTLEKLRPWITAEGTQPAEQPSAPASP